MRISDWSSDVCSSDLSKWSADYNAATGNKVNYQSIGSGGGIAQIKAGTVDFGSSDAPLSSEELAEAGLLQFPSVIGGVVPVVNVEGIEAGELKLTGPLLAAIYLGKVRLERRRCRKGVVRKVTFRGV